MLSRGKPATTAVLTSVLSLLVAAPAPAAELPATTTTLTAPAAYAQAETPVTVRVTDEQQAPVADAEVTLERRSEGVWSTLDTLTTDDDGQAVRSVVLRRRPDNNVFRARYAGSKTLAASGSGNVQVELLRRRSTVTLTGPETIVDETSVQLDVSWQTRSGLPVAGWVRVEDRRAGRWRLHSRVRTDADGLARLQVAPRRDSRWRAVSPDLDWVEGAVSEVHLLDNLPPGTPVLLPAAAPRPRVRLPQQPFAVGAGANPVVGRIPDRVWRHMTGISWHRGCPVGRPGLRLLRVNYWNYAGYRRRGEMVVAAGAAPRVSAALSAMYRRQLPIRSMYRVDRFGWSRRLQGGDDYASMAAGNASAFNCRWVVGRPGVRSPHSWGRSVDLNPWENPYRSADGWVPNRWWPSRRHPRVAWRSRDHAVVALLRSHGWRWTYGRLDAHHFDVPTAGGKVIRPRGCRGICD